MNRASFLESAESYLGQNWGQMRDDLARMVAIPSVEDPSTACEGSPFGAQSRQALDTILDIAQRMGFATHDGEGYVGYCQTPDSEGPILGAISHVDVVPAGEGWHTDPFALVERDGYLIGRGVIDDKGPGIMALHAMNLVKDVASPLPCTLKFLFGAGEETGMGDVTYYLEHYPAPDFLFTPDADFPVCNGEKGHCQGRISCKTAPGTRFLELAGGSVANAVPAQAHALVSGEHPGLPEAEGITVLLQEGATLIQAQGRAAHASTPEKGVSAIQLLLGYLLDNHLAAAGDLPFLELVLRLSSATDGRGVGIQAEDAFFGPLTAVVGIIGLEDGLLSASLDCRYPNTTNAAAISSRMTDLAQEAGCSYEQLTDQVPFLVDSDDPCVQALLDAYNQITGEGARTFTMGGATYARKFPRACSFGIEKPWLTTPDWVGGMHGPDEAIAEDLLKEAFKIYALALWNLVGMDC